MPKSDSIDLSSKIPGWGADLDPANRPGVPKEKAPPHGTGAHWKEPEHQVPKVKIFKTIERPELTAVFGTSCPPKGLSGKLREIGYQYGEARLARWLTLLVADRVDMVETILGDILKGTWQNPISEMGLRSEFEEGGHLESLKRRSGLLWAGAGALALGAVVLSSRRFKGEGYEQDLDSQEAA